jgi:hypothetical protein
MSLMLIILYMVIIIADGVTFNNSGQISHSENSNNIKGSEVFGSFNHSPASPHYIGRIPSGFNDNLTDLGFAHATTNDGTFSRHLAVIHYDPTLDHVR